LFYLPLALLTWVLSARLIDRRRLPALLVYGLFGSVLATLQDRLVLTYQLWEYHDTGTLGAHTEIALLISLSAAPVFAMRFAQKLQPGAPPPWLRMLRYTLVAMLPEIVGLYTDNIRYYRWWNLGWSVLAYVPIWTSIWLLHRWLSPPVTPAYSAAPDGSRR
jgi:hypothetical protein